MDSRWRASCRHLGAFDRAEMVDCNLLETNSFRKFPSSQEEAPPPRESLLEFSLRPPWSLKDLAQGELSTGVVYCRFPSTIDLRYLRA